MWPFNRAQPTMTADPASTVPEPQSSAGVRLTGTNVTVNQLLDVISGSGDDGLSVVYKPMLYGRNSAICLTALNRAVSLISSVAALLFSNGYYRIVDQDGKLDMSPKAEALRAMLCHSLDGYESSSYNIKDAMADLLLDGNMLLWVDRGEGGIAKRMVRLVPWSATTINKDTDGWTYHAEVSHMVGYQGSYVDVPSQDVVHGRMAHLSRIHGSGGTRSAFSRAPVILMRPALECGLALDDYVRNFSRAGHRQNISFDFKGDGGGEKLSPDQKKELSDYIRSQQRMQMGYIIQQDATATDITPKIDQNLAALREWQVQEVGRYYGVPAPLLGANVTSWGQGIAELGRLFVNYGAVMHMQDFANAIAFRCLEPGSRIELDYTKLVPADAKSKAELLNALRGDGQRVGCATMDELRDAADLSQDYDPAQLVNQNPVGGQVKDSSSDSSDETPEDDEEAMKWART